MGKELLFSNYYFQNKDFITKRYLSKKANDELHLTFADTDCSVSSFILEDLNKAIKVSVFPYIYYHSQDLNAINHWYKFSKIKLTLDNYLSGDGVIQLVQSSLLALTNSGDAVLVNLPAYKPFLDSISNLNLKLVPNHLNRDKNNKYQIDFKLLEQQIIENRPKVFIFCNPHNPTGRVFLKEELVKLLKLAQKYSFYIISDEIWQDIFYYHPTTPLIKATNNKNLLQFAISISSFATAFNFFSIHAGYLLSWNKELITKIREVFEKLNWYPSSDIFHHTLLNSCYLNKKNKKWLKIKLNYLKESFLYLKKTLRDQTKIIVTNSEGTTITWLDFSQIVKDEQELEFRFKKIKVFPLFGNSFGSKYKFFVRLNYFLSLEQLKNLLQRLTKEFRQ